MIHPIQWLADKLSPYRSDRVIAQERAVAVAAYRSLTIFILSEPTDSKLGSIAAQILRNADTESAPYVDETMEPLKAWLAAQIEL